MRIALIVTVFFLLPAAGLAQTTRYVPDDHPTIQGAIDACVNGDTVIVRPGTYVENIDFSGKAITVQSEQGAAVTAIDGNQAGSVVTIQSGEGAASVLEGFTIRNGSTTSFGGGILCANNSSPTIRNNVVTLNSAAMQGGGIFCAGSPAVITNNVISRNTADRGSGDRVAT